MQHSKSIPKLEYKIRKFCAGTLSTHILRDPLPPPTFDPRDTDLLFPVTPLPSSNTKASQEDHTNVLDTSPNAESSAANDMFQSKENAKCITKGRILKLVTYLKLVKMGD